MLIVAHPSDSARYPTRRITPLALLFGREAAVFPRAAQPWRGLSLRCFGQITGLVICAITGRWTTRKAFPQVGAVLTCG